MPQQCLDSADQSGFKYSGLSQGLLGICFVPASAPNSTGELTFGDIDSSVVTNPVNYVPITLTAPASNYWGIDGSTPYGGWTILDSGAGIVDAGTTLILIASGKTYGTIYVNARVPQCPRRCIDYKVLTGATEDSATGLLTITQDQYDNLANLTFMIGGISPPTRRSGLARSTPSSVVGSTGSTLWFTTWIVYLVMVSTSSLDTPSCKLIFGFRLGKLLRVHMGVFSPHFSERYYSVFDTTTSQVGFASTAYTTAMVN